MEEMTQAINAVTSPMVQMWMNWMLVIFALSILFVWNYPVARFALAAFVLSAVVGLVIFKFTKEPYLLGLSHIMFWTPLAIYMYRNVVNRETFKPQSVFGIWVILLLTTILISLVFDVMDVVLVLLGKK